MSLSDINQREAALDIHRSFCVTAPAGSGKTELLTQRFLKLLAVVDEPEDILAITFTRKARAEMSERIMRALEMGFADKPERPYLQTTWQAAKTVIERDALKNWNLLNNPKRLRIQTIDSLNQAIAGESPLLNGFGSTPIAVDNATALYEQVIPRLLANIDSPDMIGEALRRVLLMFNSDTRRFSDLLNTLLAKRDQWLHYLSAGDDYDAFAQYLQQTLGQWLEEDLQYAKECLQRYEPDIADRLLFAAKHANNTYLQSIAEACTLPDSDISSLKAWQALVGWLTTATGGLRKTMQLKQGYPAQKEAKDKATKDLYKYEKDQVLLLLKELGSDEAVKPALLAVSKIPQAVSEEQTRTIVDILCVLKHAVAHLNIIFAEVGECDHIQVAHVALNLLDSDEAPTASQLRWTNRIKHILVDEYQDTSFIQNAIMAKFIGLWDEAREIAPEVLRSLFVVGDGMQSIYRFRAANVGLFIQAQQRGIGTESLHALTLTQNFRSQSGIVAWFNRIFECTFPVKADIAVGAVPYTQAVSVKQEQSTVEAHGFENSDDEAIFIANKIEQIQQSHSSASCAVLVRSKKHLLLLIRELKRKQINYSSADTQRLIDIPAVIDLFSLSRWVLDPSDDIALAAIFRAPWCGASTQDLHQLRQLCSVNTPLFYQLLEINTDLLPQRIGLCAEILKQYWQERHRKPLADAVKGMWLALKGDMCAEDSLQYTEQYLQCLREQGNTIDSELSLQRIFQNEFAQSDASKATVHLMTIHKSKGLEFDAVFLMGLAKTGRADDNAMVEYAERLYSNGNQGVLLAPWGKTQSDKQLRDYVKHLGLQADTHESLRVLYVGATRAIASLYLSFCYKQDEKSEEFKVKPPAKQSLISPIWSFIENDIIYHEPSDNKPSLDKTMVTLKSRRLKYDHLGLLPSTTFDEPLLTDTPDSQQDSAETAFGTLIHELLEYLGGQTPASVNQTLLAGVLNAKILYNPHIDNKEEAKKQAGIVLDTVLNTEQGQNIVFNQYKAHSEWPLTVQNIDQSISRYIIDKSYVEANTRWIVDYKITSPKDGQSLSDFLHVQTQQYSMQLARYRYAVSMLASHKESGYDIKTALYFPLINTLHLVNP